MKKYSIVIVENDEDEQFFMKEGFDAAGVFDVVAMLKNGNHLSEWLGKNKAALPDLVLSDLNMPGKNGYDILTEMKNTPEYAHIPVIITSTSSTKMTIEKCLSLGAADYVAKPETFVEYEPFVRNLYRLVEQKQFKTTE